MGLHSGSKFWKKDETAALIALYETERCLYDFNDPDFGDSAKQKKAYERIHIVMLRIRPNCTAIEIKNKINSLQKQYLAELLQKNISIKAGTCTENTFKSSMWCFGLLQFLDPYLPNKNAPISVEEDNEKLITDKDKEISDLKISNHHTNHNNKGPAAVSDSVVKDNSVEDKTEEKNVGKRRKLEITFPQSVPKVKDSSTPIDREDIFGQYVASEMKGLKENPLLYLQTKQTILEILTSANFELINPE